MPTIALVDDDRNILTSVSLSLEAEGYRVQSYTDGASALEGLKTSPPDLAIFDIKMPRMDGMELLRRLRQRNVFFKLGPDSAVFIAWARNSSQPVSYICSFGSNESPPTARVSSAQCKAK